MTILSTPYKTVVEYIWIGGNYEIRSKTMVLSKNINTIFDLPDWNYDGSSTNQANSEQNTEIIIKPKMLCIDPIKTNTIENANCLLALCDTYLSDGVTPHNTNSRYIAEQIFNKKLDELPWFGIEQEYFFNSVNNSNVCLCADLGEYYCGIQNDKIEQKIVNEHLVACIECGLKISGINAEVAKSQWEYQIGPCTGIESGDHMIISRYLLEKIASKYDVWISYAPKLYDDANGSGCHVNFSTFKMRETNGISHIYSAIKKLENKHVEHMEMYGDGNKERMTGVNETACYDKFTYGIGTRNTSVRIGNQTYKDSCGYFEDRRPGANINPYLVTSKIFKTCCVDDDCDNITGNGVKLDFIPDLSVE
jgi:glutamine synthetase